MTNLRIGVETLSLRQPLKQALHTAATLGVAGIEIDLRRELPAAELSQTGVRQVRKLLSDLGLQLAAATFPTRRGYDEPQELERRILATQQAMKLAYELGARVLVNRVGNVPVEPEDARFDRLVQSLHLLAASGEKYGVRLAARTELEGAPLKRLLDALPAGAIGLDLDPGCLIASGNDPQEVLSHVGSAVIHMHATDAVFDFALGRATEVELGRGIADIPALLGRLEEFDYRDWVVIKRREATSPVLDLENAVAFLRSV